MFDERQQKLELCFDSHAGCQSTGRAELIFLFRVFNRMVLDFSNAAGSNLLFMSEPDLGGRIGDRMSNVAGRHWRRMVTPFRFDTHHTSSLRLHLETPCVESRVVTRNSQVGFW